MSSVTFHLNLPVTLPRGSAGLPVTVSVSLGTPTVTYGGAPQPVAQRGAVSWTVQGILNDLGRQAVIGHGDVRSALVGLTADEQAQLKRGLREGHWEYLTDNARSLVG
jgi:hypothetical protein